jgi:hypothetical protein
MKSVKEAGPYYITSHSQGRGIVYFMVYPAFPEYNSKEFQWAESRYKGSGGGPGIFSSIATARVLGEFLNSVYPASEVDGWVKVIKPILDDEQKSSTFAECETCGTVSFISKKWIYCPICGKRFKKDSM